MRWHSSTGVLLRGAAVGLGFRLITAALRVFRLDGRGQRVLGGVVGIRNVIVRRPANE
jgi:hypothetical protein